MESQKTSDSHRSLKKDYSKLEKIFDKAVEKINQKKIIYYASDRLISDDSKKQFLRNTYKSFAWASPLTKEDIHTELINLDTNELVSLFPRLMEDQNSLLSFLEITSEKEENAPEENTLELETQEVFHEEPEEKAQQDLSESTQEFLDWYYLRKKEITETQPEEDDLLINSEFLKEPVEEIKTEPLKESVTESSAYFSNLYNLAKKPKKIKKPEPDLSLFELIKSIQEDDNFYNRKEPEKEKKLEEALTESTLVKSEVNEIEEAIIEPSEIEEVAVETIEETEPEVLETPTPIIIEETPKTEIEFTTNEGKEESDLNRIVQTHERRVVFQNSEQKDFFFNEADKSEHVATPEKIAAAKKDYNTSSIAFLISLILTGFYIYLIHADLYNFDYLAIVMIVIGIFGAWELDSKKTTIMVCIMLVLIAGFMGYRYFEYDRYLDVTHMLWLLLIPLNVISSYMFMNSRKRYSHLLHQGKRRRPVAKTSSNSNNESILFTTKDN